ncbi:molybdopterin-dependent oxidoreductase [Candidatus Falkowbacteria bacterium]|jgi:DMSO/TMAO reductase YedYZ molybdopterin-dependent catalytic subunit|nr:molybdopterin-dependent oxidoreductase [Candidatus Falkowbacteria bacterium]MBT7348566.1 molybdopterin-dependent oxidoreductase [Candidatus Falkowbacteria bacterium]MBT7501050.1 molybdopterin-dependent oxidoreductase [Candidatus Falkowbacteria bacterium]
MIKKNLKYILYVLLIVVVAVFIYNMNGKISRKSELPKELIASQINEYEGKDLSSIDDFRENSIKGPQYIDKESYQLKIKGLNNEKTDYNYDEIVDNNQSYKKVVTLNCVEGWSVDILWEGFLMKDFISREKIPEEFNTVIFRAYDGYSTSFPIEYIYDNNIMIAYKMNGLELPPERGFPFQLVAETKFGYKWIKWITEIEFSDDENYQGYWESRGYSNDGDLKKDFLK